jgi:hypothetical protein
MRYHRYDERVPALSPPPMQARVLTCESIPDGYWRLQFPLCSLLQPRIGAEYGADCLPSFEPTTTRVACHSCNMRQCLRDAYVYFKMRLLVLACLMVWTNETRTALLMIARAVTPSSVIANTCLPFSSPFALRIDGRNFSKADKLSATYVPWAFLLCEKIATLLNVCSD